MSEATHQAISYKTVFETFYMYVWMESIHYFLHTVEKYCKMETGYFQQWLMGHMVVYLEIAGSGFAYFGIDQRLVDKWWTLW